MIYLSISGNYIDEKASDYNQCQCEIIYIINGENIIAWYYNLVSTSLTIEGSWQTTIYCREYSGDITTINEEVLKGLVDKCYGNNEY